MTPRFTSPPISYSEFIPVYKNPVNHHKFTITGSSAPWTRVSRLVKEHRERIVEAWNEYFDA